MAEFITTTAIKSITHKALGKHELLFRSGLLAFEEYALQENKFCKIGPGELSTTTFAQNENKKQKVSLGRYYKSFRVSTHTVAKNLVTLYID